MNEGVFYVDAARLLPTEELTKPGEGYDTEKAVEEKIQQIQQNKLEPIEVCHQKPVNTYRLADKPMEKSGQAEPFYYVLNGHHRLEAIKRLGVERVPVYLTSKEVNEDKAPLLEEGTKDWWNNLMLDLASVQMGQKPTRVIGTVANRIEDTEYVKNLKGDDLAKYLGITLRFVDRQIKKPRKGEAIAAGSPTGDLAHQARQIRSLIAYAEDPDNSNETFGDILQNASVKHARTPEARTDATKLTAVVDFLGGAATVVAKAAPEMIGDAPLSEDYDLQNHPKKEWIKQDLSTIDEEIMNYLFDQYKTVYTAEGMDLSAYSAKELQSGYEIVMLIDVDNDPMPDAFIFVRGSRLKLAATDGEKLSKSMLVKKMVEMVTSEGYSIEASKKLEDIMKSRGAPPITDKEQIEKMVGPKFIRHLSDGFYERGLKKGGVVVKRLYGTSTLSEEEGFQKNMKKQLPAELDFLLKKGGNNTKVGPGVKNPKKPKFKSAPPGTAPVGEGAED